MPGSPGRANRRHGRRLPALGLAGFLFFPLPLAERFWLDPQPAAEVAEIGRWRERVGPDGESAHLFLRLARARISLAQLVRARRSRLPELGAVFASFSDEAFFTSLYGLARGELATLLARWPDAPEAPEAQYLLGEIHDQLHLADFPAALEGYRATVERYPGTAAATRARGRIGYLEDRAGHPAGERP